MTYIVYYLNTLSIEIMITTVCLLYHDLRCGRIRYRGSCMTFDVGGLVVIKLPPTNKSEKPYSG